MGRAKHSLSAKGKERLHQKGRKRKNPVPLRFLPIGFKKERQNKEFRVNRKLHWSGHFRFRKQIFPVELAAQTEKADGRRQNHSPPQNSGTSGENTRFQRPSGPEQKRQDTDQRHRRKLLPAERLYLAQCFHQFRAKPERRQQAEEL